MQSRNVKSPYPAIFIRAGSLDPILNVIVFEKFRFPPSTRKHKSGVFNTEIPLWRAKVAFSVTVFNSSQRKSCDFKRKRIRVDGAWNIERHCTISYRAYANFTIQNVTSLFRAMSNFLLFDGNSLLLFFLSKSNSSNNYRKCSNYRPGRLLNFPRQEGGANSKGGAYLKGALISFIIFCP